MSTAPGSGHSPRHSAPPRRTPTRRRRRFDRLSLRRLCSLAFLFTTLAAAARPAATLPEYEVKATFLLNFTKFVEWPADTWTSDSEPLVLGILGDDPYGKTLQATVAARGVEGRPLVVWHLSRPQQAARAHILFVSSSESARYPEILAATRDSSVLTVGDETGFAANGGVINFVIVDRKVRFEINESAARRAGLKLSSQLLDLATVVGPRPADQQLR